MKYIPLPPFEAVNSLLHRVDVGGCRTTVRLEAFTCRHTREERRLAAELAHYAAAVQRTPPLSPAMDAAVAVAGAPPPLRLSDPALPRDGDAGADPRVCPAEPGVDDRLVFLVAALNGLYGRDGYDFSVLTAGDFVAHAAATVRDEVQRAVRDFPESCGPATRSLWAVIESQVLDESRGCEVYEFCCPSCDPRAARCSLSRHFFFYNRARKVVVCLLLYAEDKNADDDEEEGEDLLERGPSEEAGSLPRDPAGRRTATEARGEVRRRAREGEDSDPEKESDWGNRRRSLEEKDMRKEKPRRGKTGV